MEPLRVGYPTRSTVQWSDGSDFDGYALVGIKQLLDASSAAWPSLVRGHSSRQRVMPFWAILPIENGHFDTSYGVVYNADLTPPQSNYVAFYFDATGKRVGTVSTAFTVSSNTFTVPLVTLTAPTVGANPTPN